jgi:copper chaperone CopZ
MKHIFKIENVKCGGCANTIKTKLLKDFGIVEINLDKTPREITVDIEDNRVNELKYALKQLGYPFSSEKLGFIEGHTSKAKSFVSCAIGKID